MYVSSIVDTLECYSRDDGTSFLTSPSLREMQANARDRQARELGPTIPRDAWSHYKGSAPSAGFAARWLPEHGWVVVTYGLPGINLPGTMCAVMASLPDLPAAVDHPVFEPNPVDARNPFVVGGNRSIRGSGLYIRPTGLGMGCGVFFHTRYLDTYRDGGSWTVSEAHLVMLNETGKPHYSWGRDGFVTRLPVQVIAAVEWLGDPSRESNASERRPVMVSQRELLMRYRDGKLQRMRLAAMHGQLGALVPQLVDTTPDELTKSEIELLECVTKRTTS